MVGNVAIALAGLMLMAAAPAADVESLAWMSGAWISETDEGWVEELWTEPRGGMILGTNRSGEGATATGFEFLRIETDADGTISYKASPGGQAPIAFRLVSSGPNEAVFENPAHDYPTRIVYRRDGDSLVATVSGPQDSNKLSWTFRRPEGR